MVDCEPLLTCSSADICVPGGQATVAEYDLRMLSACSGGLGAAAVEEAGRHVRPGVHLQSAGV